MARRLIRKPLVTVREAAEMFGLRAEALRRAILDGRVAAVRSGSVWLVRPSSVEVALRKRRMRKGRIPQQEGKGT